MKIHLQPICLITLLTVAASSNASIINVTESTGISALGYGDGHPSTYFMSQAVSGGGTSTLSVPASGGDGSSYVDAACAMAQTLTSNSAGKIAAYGNMDSYGDAFEASGAPYDFVVSTESCTSLFDFDLTSFGHLHFDMQPWLGTYGGVTYCYLDGAYVGGFAQNNGDQILIDMDLAAGHHNFEISGGASNGVYRGQYGSWESHTKYNVSLTSAVPEPATMSLGFGVAALFVRKRKRA